MNDLLDFLGHLSLGEFIVIWTPTIVIVLFGVFLICYLQRMEKDSNLLKANIKKMLDRLQQ